MSSNTMYLDDVAMRGRVRLLEHVVMPAKVRAGLGAAGTRWLSDCIMEPPTAPIHRTLTRSEYGMGIVAGYGGTDTREPGELRASGAVFVNRAKVKSALGMSTEMATGKYQPGTYGGTPIIPFIQQACVVFNAPYAMEQHEFWDEKTNPGSGKYYLSTKLYAHGIEYMGIVVQAARL